MERTLLSLMLDDRFFFECDCGWGSLGARIFTADSELVILVRRLAILNCIFDLERSFWLDLTCIANRLFVLYDFAIGKRIRWSVLLDLLLDWLFTSLLEDDFCRFS